MKKFLFIILSLVFMLTACSNNSDQKHDKDMKTYKLESGKTIKVPKHPKRVAVMNAFYVGDVIKLGIKPVAVPEFTKNSSVLAPYLKDTKLVGDNDVEQVLKAKPDLIIADSSDKNIKKYEKIAPTVSYTYTKYNYKSILKEIGKLVGEEKKASTWIDKWDKTTQNDKTEIKKKVGNSTASVFELYAKQIYIFQKNWGRGLDIVHDAFGMPMTKTYKQKIDSNKAGYDTISSEDISNYAGDYIFLCKSSNSKTSIENSNLWDNLKAVKQHHVITYKAEDYQFTDPITLDALRKKLKSEILEKP
ncbi:ABC transporter substrate-binding protein [Staphylococcus epidermidis]|uniref:ABC transporter substrate-binding protein n=1 Tax=Staphylococcus epidermidis TaxID=1282 RepID=UPI00187A5BB8|nr:ABC transporter substrate-binding protein [Staphylococcus epidermidis]MBE7320037.1 ABC transporter substrate-binding protein [Staphylococcus epidermidis]MDS3931298.1 ABC transporter substrate-binding protein [Staphylococcus epidermidis]